MLLSPFVHVTEKLEFRAGMLSCIGSFLFFYVPIYKISAMMSKSGRVGRLQFHSRRRKRRQIFKMKK